jgi:hypothetical protein
MPTETYAVTAADAAETVSQLLERDDVRSIRVQDVDGETLLDVSGATWAEAGARELFDRWGDYDGGGLRVTVVAETEAPPDEPGHGRILEEPPEHPEEGEPRPHG